MSLISPQAKGWQRPIAPSVTGITPGGAFKLYPPSFQSIAAYMTPDVIRMKITFPDHAVIMPQFHTYLLPTNLDNIVGYIESLDK